MKYRITIDLDLKGASPSFLDVKDFIGRAIITKAQSNPFSPFGALEEKDITFGSIIARGVHKKNAV